MGSLYIMIETQQIIIYSKRSVFMENDTKRLNIVISANIHRDLKVAAAKSGKTLQNFVSEAITEKLKKEREKY